MKKLTLQQELQLVRNYREFVKKYGEYLQNYDMPKYFFRYLANVFGYSEYSSGRLAQIMEATGAAEMLDFNLWFNPNYDKMREYFDLDGKNLVEVGAGLVPVLADKIAGIHDTSFVTAIDPTIIPNWSDKTNLRTIRAPFYLSVNTIDVANALNNCDMMYATYPCEATISMIREANARDLDYYLAMCGCIHLDNYTNYKDYADYVLNVAKTGLPLGREIEIQKDYNILGREWPIIVSYKKR